MFEDILKYGVNGKEEVIDGETYWMGSKVQKCPKCGVAPTNVDDCGEFGDPTCPYFGIGLDEYEEKYGKLCDDEGWYNAHLTPNPNEILDVFVKVKPNGYHGRIIDVYWSDCEWCDRYGRLDEIFQNAVTHWRKAPKAPYS